MSHHWHKVEIGKSWRYRYAESKNTKCVDQTQYIKASVSLIQYRFSAFRLRSKCSICSRRCNSRRCVLRNQFFVTDFWKSTEIIRVYLDLSHGSSRYCSAIESGPLSFSSENGTHHINSNEKRKPFYFYMSMPLDMYHSTKTLWCKSEHLPYPFNEMKQYNRMTSVECFFFLLFDKKCCSGRLVLPPTRSFSSSQHVFDQRWSFTSW